VTVTGSEKSSLGSVLLHAYSKVENDLIDQTNPRTVFWHDFVLVKGLGGKHLLAQIMGIFEIFDKINQVSLFFFFFEIFVRSSSKRAHRL